MDKYILSIKKNLVGIYLITIAALFTSLGQLFWKLSSQNLVSFKLVLGFLLYGVGAILMIIAFKYGSLSVLHPMLGLAYVFALFFGSIFLNEEVSLGKLVGVFLILLGIILIGSGDSD